MMRKIVLAVTAFIISASAAFGQGTWNKQSVNNKVNRQQVDSVLIAPRDTSATNKALYQGAPVGDSGRIAYQFGKFWGHYGALGWQAIGSDPDLSNYYTKLESDTIFRNYVQAWRYGAKGNGVADDQTAITSATHSNKNVFLNAGDYLVTSLDNVKGAEFHGDGRIVKAITGGLQQLNTYADRDKYVLGAEYLSYVQKAIMNRADETTVIKVIWSGDSSTAGTGVNSNYRLDSLWRQQTELHGIGNITSVNSGHGGDDTEDWLTTHMPVDTAAHPDLYIVRWGINDAVTGDVDDFITRLRTGLAQVRSWKGVDKLSIILMTPNSTSDTPNGRDEKWYEQINPAIKQAARDFQCTYIDTYAMWYDSRHAANNWMDDPFSDGRAIHPTNIMNTWIVSTVFDQVFPRIVLRKASKSNLQNYVSTDRLLNPATLPPALEFGVSLDRAFRDTYPAWPMDGQTTTIKQSNGVSLQINSTYLTSDGPQFYFRTSGQGVAAPPSTATWSDWQHVGFKATSLTLQNGWSGFESFGAVLKNGVVFLDGNIRNGNAATETLLFTLPVGFRPVNAKYFILPNGIPVTGTATIRVEADGDVFILSGSNDLVALDGVSFIAATEY